MDAQLLLEVHIFIFCFRLLGFLASWLPGFSAPVVLEGLLIATDTVPRTRRELVRLTELLTRTTPAPRLVV